MIDKNNVVEFLNQFLNQKCAFSMNMFEKRVMDCEKYKFVITANHLNWGLLFKDYKNALSLKEMLNIDTFDLNKSKLKQDVIELQKIKKEWQQRLDLEIEKSTDEAVGIAVNMETDFYSYLIENNDNNHSPYSLLNIENTIAYPYFLLRHINLLQVKGYQLTNVIIKKQQEHIASGDWRNKHTFVLQLILEYQDEESNDLKYEIFSVIAIMNSDLETTDWEIKENQVWQLPVGNEKIIHTWTEENGQTFKITENGIWIDETIFVKELSPILLFK